MKKSLIALAALGAFAGAASAQSSVTLFGVVDLGVRQVKNAGGDSLTTMSTDGQYSSRLGVRGVEDLGGGLKAGFWLEGNLAADAGTAGATDKQADKLNRFWHRRATASLMGGFGEIRLGRDLNPTYLVVNTNDVFGEVGVGQLTTVFSLLKSTSYDTQSRTDNMVSYLTPSTLGGFYAQLSAAPGESVNGKKYVGGRAGYAAGPLDVSVGYAQTSDSGVTNVSDKYKVANVGGSYDFGVAKLYASVTQNKLGSAKQLVSYVGAAVPVSSAGKVKLSVINSNMKDSGDDANKFALGYVHSLSKRTSLYGTYALVKNRGAAAYNVSGAGVPATLSTGDKSRGVEFGMTHMF